MRAAPPPTDPATKAVGAPTSAPPATGLSAVFRRDDDQLCHARCRTPLAYQGVRGRQEADFYCLACMATITVPLVVLASLLGPAEAPAHGTLHVMPGGAEAARGARPRRARTRDAA